MPFFKSDDLSIWTGGKWFNLERDKKPDIHGFTADSRNVEKDFAFIALKGERDGHDFAADAVKNGATAIIAERELDVPVPILVVKNTLKAFQTIAKFHRLRFENPVVAITGSCGKTSTKEMLAKLTAWKNPLVTEKNFNNEIGVPLTLTQIDLRKNQLAIIEAGVGAPNQMTELAEMIEPDIAIVTNVGLTHLERFGEVANVAKEKAVLPAHVAEGGWCLLNRNLLSWKAFDDIKCKKAVVASADAPEFKADLIFRYAFAQSENEGMVAIDMCVEGGSDFYFEVPDMSVGMLENSVLAIAAALMLGAIEELLVGKLEHLAPLPMRGGLVKTEKATFYIDCYNASPTSMKDALAQFAKVSKSASKRLYVLGSMSELGLARHRHHKEIGSKIPHVEGDRVIVVGESADIYKSGLIEAAWTESEIKVCEKAEEALGELENFEGFVFVKGSRVCELEKSLPASVMEKINAAPAEEVESEEEFEEPETQYQTPSKNNDDDDLSDDEFDDIDDNGEEYDSDETISRDDDEDERERI